MKHLLIGAVLALSCASTPEKKPSGVWKMGPVTSPSSSLEDQFPAAAWAKNVSGGSFVGLSEDGKIYGGIPNEGPLINGSWSDSQITFSFDGESPKKLSISTSFTGSFLPQSDTISGKLSQKITISQDVSIEYIGDISFTRVVIQ